MASNQNTWRWTWLALVSAMVLIAGLFGYFGITPKGSLAYVLGGLFVFMLMGIVNLAMYEMQVLDEEVREARWHDRRAL